MLSPRASLLMVLCLLFSHPAHSDDDHERARRALQKGDIRSLTDIMGQLRAELGGEVIEIKLKNRKGNRNFAYEFKVLTPKGRVSEVLVDATTARILEREVD
jgi:uncharacterized membrane protein YkoI